MNTQTDLDGVIEDFSRALLALDRLQAAGILGAYCAGRNPYVSVEEVVIPSLESIGARFEKGELALSQVYMSGLICEETVDELLLESGFDISALDDAEVGIAVLEDHHALGKKIVELTLRSAGFHIRDYGVGVSVEDLVDRALADNIKVLMISVLMLPAALKIPEIRRRLDETDNGRKIKLLVGGAPFRFDKNLWREAGADAVATNSADVIKTLERMLREPRQ